MNFLLKTIQSFTQKGVNLIIELENKEKIRDDFIEIYRVCVIPKEGPLRLPYFSQNIRFYYDRLLYWRLCAKNLDVNNSTKKIEEIVDVGESISDLFTIIDSFLTLGAILPSCLLMISIIEQWHPLISLFFLIFAVPLILLKVFIKLIFVFRDEIRQINENLVITQDDVNYGGRFHGKKESIIAAYIWNRSLCNYSIITSVIFLILIKAISNRIYQRIFNSMIRLLPLYMPEFVKDKSRLKFLRFVITHRKNKA